MKNIILLIFSMLTLTSCSLMRREDRMARSGDVLNRLSRTMLVAQRQHKFGQYTLKLRKNQTFVFRENFMGINNSYYCGRYYLEGNVLLLEFAEERKPEELDRVMILTAENGQLYFRGANHGMYIKITNDIEEAVKSIKNEIGFTPPSGNISPLLNSGFPSQSGQAPIHSW
ncbi:hypothetical protein [Flavobacterium album]|uniref:hypothetical protein n=1 Tax=Flavobacterium album TaxID=2175091 RepID=UPI0011B27FD2|nr:hypothetical protein [Flavobacterium album]